MDTDVMDYGRLFITLIVLDKELSVSGYEGVSVWCECVMV